jgi:hypothetical protein
MRLTEAGIELDSEFTVELLDGQPTITMSSHSGRSEGRPARNSQYSDALRVVLERLADLDARIIDALVVSSTSLRDYPDKNDRRFGGRSRFGSAITTPRTSEPNSQKQCGRLLAKPSSVQAATVGAESRSF